MEACVINLDGEGKFTRLLSGKPRTGGMKSGLVIIHPGESCGEHTTGAREEMLVILEGTGRLYFGTGTHLEISAGQAAYVPPDTFHDVKNMGSLPLKYVYVVSPVGV